MKSWKLGSPPRRRGKDKAEHLVQDHIGITPAQAGKRCYLCASTKSSWDHPRVGGEKVQRTNQDQTGLGSPPRGRGKATGIEVPVSAERITPAWAGKSGLQGQQPDGAQDHPRVGGEKCFCCASMVSRLGSPPRGRGKAKSILISCGARRITPAWAGKS